MKQWELARRDKRDGQPHQLEIVTDSCFSGRVVFDAAQRGQRDVFVQAACGVGGVEHVLDDVAATFTTAWIRQQRLHFGLLTHTPEEAELERRVGYCRFVNSACGGSHLLVRKTFASCVYKASAGPCNIIAVSAILSA